MSNDDKEHILIPALIAAVAAYFGFKKKSERLSVAAKNLVCRAIDDQTNTNHKNRRQARNRNRCRYSLKRNYRDRYYE